MTTHDRSIDIDDISEVRRGKLCSTFDSAEDMQCVSIIASEAVIVLSLHGESEAARNIFVRKLQAFLKVMNPCSVGRCRCLMTICFFFQMNRDTSIFEQDSPDLFKPVLCKKRIDHENFESTEAQIKPQSSLGSGSTSRSMNAAAPVHFSVTHSNALRSMSIFRQSSQSSRGGASFSESLHESLHAMRESFLDFKEIF